MVFAVLSECTSRAFAPAFDVTTLQQRTRVLPTGADVGGFERLNLTLDDVREANVDLVIDGPEGYRLEGTNDMGQISRDPVELVRQCLSEHHYPDGFVLFCGTLFAPTQDRDTPGAGFTHKPGDEVTIIDANITTALAGVILLNYTSGPIRGFAVTLLMGIICSVFTAVYVCRRIFNWYLESRQPQTLSI